ncbi:MAG TPA: response regulator [Caldimonas sp.]|jgi:FixJ family two-component response regulator
MGANRAYRIYLVDDDRSVRTSLTRLLRVSGFEVQPFDTPEQFLAEVHDDRQSCVLLDMSMPRVPGLEVQARLQEMGIGLPLIAMSARDDDGVREAARTLGAKFFLRKPVDDQALLDAISWVTASSTPSSAP